MSALPIKSDTRKSLTPSPDLCVSHAGHLATWTWGQVPSATEENGHLQPTCLMPGAGHLATHSPHSAAWWYRSWCTRQSLWSQPESYSWLTPTWRQQKCWRSPPCKWRSQTQQRSPRISGRKTEETQWTRCRRRVSWDLAKSLMTKENKATAALTQQSTTKCILFTVANPFSRLFVFSYSSGKTTVSESW